MRQRTKLSQTITNLSALGCCETAVMLLTNMETINYYNICIYVFLTLHNYLILQYQMKCEANSSYCTYIEEKFKVNLVLQNHSFFQYQTTQRHTLQETLMRKIFSKLMVNVVG